MADACARCVGFGIKHRLLLPVILFFICFFPSFSGYAYSTRNSSFFALLIFTLLVTKIFSIVLELLSLSMTIICYFCCRFFLLELQNCSWLLQFLWQLTSLRLRSAHPHEKQQPKIKGNENMLTNMFSANAVFILSVCLCTIRVFVYFFRRYFHMHFCQRLSK